MLVFEELDKYWQHAVGLMLFEIANKRFPIGAIVVDEAGEIISIGTNGMFGPHKIDGYISGSSVGHSEMNALAQIPLAKLEQKLMLYTTQEPCPMCFGAICVARIADLYYGARDPWAGSTNLHNANWYMRYKPMTIHHPDSDFEKLIFSLYAYGTSLVYGVGGAVFDRYCEVHPFTRDSVRKLEASVEFRDNLGKDNAEAFNHASLAILGEDADAAASNQQQ